MKETWSKSSLAITLSKLEGFTDPKVKQEQYIMDSEVGASALWNMQLLGDIGGKVIVDLGCGTGILGIGLLMLGAKKVTFLDSDRSALYIAKKNLDKVKSECLTIMESDFICKDIREISIKSVKADLVVENPPFGTKIEHIDTLFLEKALDIAPIVYSFHKSETKAFLEKFASKKNAKMTHAWDFSYPLKSTFSFHRRQIHRINVSCMRFKK
jgi:putative methylase